MRKNEDKEINQVVNAEVKVWKEERDKGMINFKNIIEQFNEEKGVEKNIIRVIQATERFIR